MQIDHMAEMKPIKYKFRDGLLPREVWEKYPNY